MAFSYIEIFLWAKLIGVLLLAAIAFVFLGYGINCLSAGVHKKSFFEWITGKKTRDGKIQKNAMAPKWLVTYCGLLVIYMVTGAILCGKTIYSIYPDKCAPAVNNCTDQDAALLLWPLFLIKPELLRGIQLDGFRRGRFL